MILGPSPGVTGSLSAPPGKRVNDVQEGGAPKRPRLQEDPDNTDTVSESEDDEPTAPSARTLPPPFTQVAPHCSDMPVQPTAPVLPRTPPPNPLQSPFQTPSHNDAHDDAPGVSQWRPIDLRSDRSSLRARSRSDGNTIVPETRPPSLAPSRTLVPLPSVLIPPAQINTTRSMAARSQASSASHSLGSSIERARAGGWGADHVDASQHWLSEDERELLTGTHTIRPVAIPPDRARIHRPADRAVPGVSSQGSSLRTQQRAGSSNIPVIPNFRRSGSHNQLHNSTTSSSAKRRLRLSRSRRLAGSPAPLTLTKEREQEVRNFVHNQYSDREASPGDDMPNLLPNDEEERVQAKATASGKRVVCTMPNCSDFLRTYLHSGPAAKARWEGP